MAHRAMSHGAGTQRRPAAASRLRASVRQGGETVERHQRSSGFVRGPKSLIGAPSVTSLDRIARLVPRPAAGTRPAAARRDRPRGGARRCAHPRCAIVSCSGALAGGVPDGQSSIAARAGRRARTLGAGPSARSPVPDTALRGGLSREPDVRPSPCREPRPGRGATPASAEQGSASTTPILRLVGHSPEAASGRSSERTGPRPRHWRPRRAGDRRRAEQPAAHPGGAGLAAAEHLPDRADGSAPPRRSPIVRLGEAEEERVHGRLDPLVLVEPARGCRSGGPAGRDPRRADPQHPLDRRYPQALDRRDGQVAVEVVAMGGVDVVAEPQARVGEAHRGRATRAAAPRTRGPPAPRCSSPSGGLAVERAPLEPRLDQVVVVVARRRRSARRPRSPRPARPSPAGGRERLGQRAVAQLDHVAEQDQAVEFRRAPRAAAREVSRRSRSAPLPRPRWRSEMMAVRITGSHPRSDRGDGTIRRGPERTTTQRSPAAAGTATRHGARGAERVAAPRGSTTRSRRDRGGNRARAREPRGRARDHPRARGGDAAQDALERTLSSPAVEARRSECSTRSSWTTSGTGCSPPTRRRSWSSGSPRPPRSGLRWTSQGAGLIEGMGWVVMSDPRRAVDRPPGSRAGFAADGRAAPRPTEVNPRRPVHPRGRRVHRRGPLLNLTPAGLGDLRGSRSAG